MPYAGTRAWRWLVPVLVLAALAGWWTVLLHQAEGSVFSRVPLLDEQQYLAAASATSHSPDQPYFMSPLYPWILSRLGLAGSANPPVVYARGHFLNLYLFQIFCWLATVLLLRLLAGQWFGSVVGPRRWLLWLPSLMLILYRPLAIYTMMVLVEMPLVFLVTLHLYLLVRFRQSLPGTAASALALGLAVLLRGSALVLLLPGAILLWTGTPALKQKVLRLGVLALVLGCVLAPAIIHNSRLTGRLSPHTLNGGLNLYLGNGPEATGLGAGFSDDWTNDPAGTGELARRLQRKSISLVEADHQWGKLARESMLADPARVLKLWLRKMRLQWQGWEMDQVTSFAGWQAEVPWLRLLIFPWWLLVILAGLGIARPGRKAWSEGRWLSLGFLLVLMSAQAFFFVVSRYRLVLLPVLTILALAGILEVVSWWEKPRPRKVDFVLPVLGCVLSAFLTVPWGLGSARAAWQPLAVANHAQRWALLGVAEQDSLALEKAAGIYQRAVAGQPDQPGPWLGYAAVLRELNRPLEAVAQLRRGCGAVASDLELRRELVATLLSSDRPVEALAEAQALLKSYPTDEPTLHNESVLLSRLNQPAAARAAARELIRAHPDQAQGYVDLGILLAREGHAQEARSVFQRGLQENPGHEILTRNLKLLESRLPGEKKN